MKLQIPHRRLNGAIYAKLVDHDGRLMLSGVTTVEGLIRLIQVMLSRSSTTSKAIS